MLISEVKGWHYYISWDNPVPANSSAMIKALAALGKVSSLKTKTSVVLSPRSTVGYRDVRSAISGNLNQKTGSAFYVNLKSGRGFQISHKTNWLWKSAP
jgi:hypothetical protein